MSRPLRLAAGLAGLAVLAFHIWNRDPTWRLVAPEAPFLALAFPAFALLGAPWRVGEPRSPSLRAAAATSALLVVGHLLDSTLLLAAAWSCLLAITLASSGVATDHPRPWTIFVLAATGFPWIATDLAGIAWPFRVSAAAVVAAVLGGLGHPAAAVGPLVHLDGIAISVDAACSGLGTLQACLLPAAFLQALPDSPRRSPLALLALVIGLAWLTNVTRVVALTGVVLGFGPAAARGPAHTAIGVAVVVIPALALSRHFRPPATAPAALR